jgi:predicted nucleic acid-binding Zn ribbon protein
MNQSGKTIMAHRMKEISPEKLVTQKECQEMIDAAIRRHNRNASIISMCVGWVVLALFAEGLLRLIGVIPPVLPWLNITLK